MHAQVGQKARNPVRGKGHDQHKHNAVDDEVEAGRIAGDQLGQFAECLDNQRTEQRSEYGSDATDDGCEQSFDGNPRPVGDTRIDE